MAGKTLKRKMSDRIARSKEVVFTAQDFLDLSDRDQVGRVFRQFVSEGVLIRFGQGLYGKAKRSSLTGNVIPVKPLPELAREALTQKLGVEVLSASDLERYNTGQSQQIPTGRVIAVRGRVSRKMVFGGQTIKYEYVS